MTEQSNISSSEFDVSSKRRKGTWPQRSEGSLFCLKRRKRLGHDNVKHVALINVGAGYLIYNLGTANIHFYLKIYFTLRLRQFSTNNRIYISQNELETAKKYGEKYQLCIVKKTAEHLSIYRRIDNFILLYFK